MSSEDLPKPQGKVYHPDFDAADADVCVQSSDGVLFKLHRNNIIAHTTSLPLPEGGDPNIATFQEPAKILEILFKFMYPTPPLPDLSDLEFEMLEELGYAAHKYQVASVMAYCDTCLRFSYLSKRPAHMLKYAIAHDWSEEVINSIARETIDLSAPYAWEVLGPAIYVKWSLYREKWLDPQDESLWRALDVDVDARNGSPIPWRPGSLELFSIRSFCVKLREGAVKCTDTVTIVDRRSPYYNIPHETQVITLPRFV